MPVTSPPNYTEVLAKPQWNNGSSINEYGQRRVVSGQDMIKAEDINALRGAIDMMYSHVHDYTDERGGC